MKKISLVMLAIVAVAAWGCGQAEEGGKAADTNTDEVAQGEHGHPHGEGEEHAVLCGGCGQAKGSDECCAEGAEKCSECELHKGSPLCCVKIPEDMKGKDFCKCGWSKGHENCCAEDVESCGDCGKQKGSPLCCQIKKDGS